MAIPPGSILPIGRMVEIARIDGDAPGPVARETPPELRVGMLARIRAASQIGTNGSAVLMYDVRVGRDPEQPDDPQPIHAKLYAADVNPLPVLRDEFAAPALADARRRYVNTDTRSISAKELAEVRAKPLTFLVTPDMVAKEKAKAEKAKADAEMERQKAIAKCRAEAEATERAKHPRFAEGTQNDRVPVDVQKALAEGVIK